MSGPSILSSIDSEVLTKLCSDNNESIATATGIENSTEALGLLYQICKICWSVWFVADVCKACENLFRDIKDRLYSVNKRIRDANDRMKTLEENCEKVQEDLYAKGAVEYYNEKISMKYVSVLIFRYSNSFSFGWIWFLLYSKENK